MLGYLHVNSLISRQQHSFLVRHSTVTNLLQSVNDWTLALNNRQNVAITACTVVQAVIKATSQSNGKGQILTPGAPKPLNGFR